MADQLLVIGAGGHVGRAIVAAAAGRDLPARGLVRSRPPTTEPPAAEVLVGDARQVDLGLSPAVASELLATTTAIVYAAGRVDLAISPVDAEREHMAPLRGALAFAERCPALEQFVFVSSMVAVGEVDGPIRSDYVPSRPKHRNFYEVAKFDGERCVRRSGIPHRIVRPGQVWTSTDGEQRPSSPVGLFEVLPLLAAGWPLPVDPGARYWVAPADTVASIAVTAAVDRHEWRAVWAVDPASPTLGELLDVLAFRHGMRAKRLPRAIGSRLARLVEPSWVGVDVPPQVLAYGYAQWDLDLRCLDDLVSRGVVTLPVDRRYVDDTIDHEIRRRTSLA